MTLAVWSKSMNWVPRLTSRPAQGGWFSSLARGPVWRLNQSTPAASPSYNDTTPPPGVYVAYVIQVVEAGSPPVTGQPNIASAATLDASYPPTVGAATVTDLAELAPPIKPMPEKSVMSASPFSLPVTMPP